MWSINACGRVHQSMLRGLHLWGMTINTLWEGPSKYAERTSSVGYDHQYIVGGSIKEDIICGV